MKQTIPFYAKVKELYMAKLMSKLGLSLLEAVKVTSSFVADFASDAEAVAAMQLYDEAYDEAARELGIPVEEEVE